jgi:hypothetical protein
VPRHRGEHLVQPQRFAALPQLVGQQLLLLVELEEDGGVGLLIGWACLAFFAAAL